MERLTKRTGNSVAYSDFNSNHSDGCYEMMDNCLQKLADYEDFAEIFEKHFSTEALKLLSDKEEFSKWLERGKWIAIKCDEINRELQAFKYKQEQGLLIELKVPLGTKIWYLSYEEDYEQGWWNIDCGIYSLSWIHYHENKEFYLTRSEAEEALAKIEKQKERYNE